MQRGASVVQKKAEAPAGQQLESISELCEDLVSCAQSPHGCHQYQFQQPAQLVAQSQQRRARYSQALAERYPSVCYLRAESSARWSRASSLARWCNCNELLRHTYATTFHPGHIWDPHGYLTAQTAGAGPRCRPSCWQACCSPRRSARISPELWAPRGSVELTRLPLFGARLLRSRNSLVAQQIHLRASTETDSQATCKYHGISTVSAYQQARQGRKRARRSVATKHQPCCLAPPVSHPSLHFHGRFLAPASAAATPSDFEPSSERAQETSDSSGACDSAGISINNSNNNNNNNNDVDNNNNNNSDNNNNTGGGNSECQAKGFSIVSRLKSDPTCLGPENKKPSKFVAWNTFHKAYDSERLARFQVKPYVAPAARLCKRSECVQLTTRRTCTGRGTARGRVRMWPKQRDQGEQEEQADQAHRPPSRQENLHPLELKAQSSAELHIIDKQRVRPISRNRGCRLDVISEDDRALPDNGGKQPRKKEEDAKEREDEEEFNPERGEEEELDAECALFPLELRRPIPELVAMCARSAVQDQSVVVITIESARSGRQSHPVRVNRAWSGADLADAIRRELAQLGDTPAGALDREARSLANQCNEHLQLRQATGSWRRRLPSGTGQQADCVERNKAGGSSGCKPKQMRLEGREDASSACKVAASASSSPSAAKEPARPGEKESGHKHIRWAHSESAVSRAPANRCRPTQPAGDSKGEPEGGRAGSERPRSGACGVWPAERRDERGRQVAAERAGQLAGRAAGKAESASSSQVSSQPAGATGAPELAQVEGKASSSSSPSSAESDCAVAIGCRPADASRASSADAANHDDDGEQEERAGSSWSASLLSQRLQQRHQQQPQQQQQQQQQQLQLQQQVNSSNGNTNSNTAADCKSCTSLLSSGWLASNGKSANSQAAAVEPEDSTASEQQRNTNNTAGQSACERNRNNSDISISPALVGAAPVEAQKSPCSPSESLARPPPPVVAAGVATAADAPPPTSSNSSWPQISKHQLTSADCYRNAGQQAPEQPAQSEPMQPTQPAQPTQPQQAHQHQSHQQSQLEQPQASKQQANMDEQRVPSQQQQQPTPANNRSILILREIDPNTPKQSVKDIFNSENCPSMPVQCEYALHNSWYVTFKDDEDAKLALAYIRRHIVTWNGQPIMARYKPKPATPSTTDSQPAPAGLVQPLLVQAASSQQAQQQQQTSVATAALAQQTTTDDQVQDAQVQQPVATSSPAVDSATPAEPQASSATASTTTTAAAAAAPIPSYQHHPAAHHHQPSHSMMHLGPMMATHSHNQHHPESHNYGYSAVAYYGQHGPIMTPWHFSNTPQYDLSEVFIFNGLTPYPLAVKASSNSKVLQNHTGGAISGAALIGGSGGELGAYAHQQHHNTNTGHNHHHHHHHHHHQSHHHSHHAHMNHHQSHTVNHHGQHNLSNHSSSMFAGQPGNNINNNNTNTTNHNNAKTSYKRHSNHKSNVDFRNSQTNVVSNNNGQLSNVNKGNHLNRNQRSLSSSQSSSSGTSVSSQSATASNISSDAFSATTTSATVPASAACKSK